MMSIKKSLLLLFLLPLFFIPKKHLAQNQFVSPEIFNEVNGLPNNEVRCLLKDSKGYLWVGTIYGLAKYDGNKFSVYKHQSDRNSISGDVISTIYEDTKGNILVGANGLSILERKTGKWTNYLHDPTNSLSISNPSVTSIAQENDSTYLVITGNGINRFNIRTGEFSLLSFSHGSRIFSSKIHEMIPSESITFSVSSTFYRYNLQDHSVIEYTAAKGYSRPVMVNGSVVGIKGTDANVSNLSRIDLSTGIETVIIKDVGSNGILFSDNSGLGFVYKGRICLFDQNFSITSTIVFRQRREGPVNEYNDVVREENETYWVATNNGLMKLLLDSPFRFFDVKSGLANEYIRSLTVDRKNNLWIGVRQGPVCMIPNIDNFLESRSGSVRTISFPTPNGEVFATNQILELRNGNLLFVTSSTLYLYSVSKGKFTSELVVDGNKQFFSAVETDVGVLVGSLEKPTLFRVIIDGEKLKVDTSFAMLNPPDVVNTLFTDRESRVWVGGEGLFYLDKVKGTNQFLSQNVIPNINVNNHSSNSVWDIVEVDNDRILVSTTTNGFYMYSKGADSLMHFGKANGLSSDFTCGVQRDSNGKFWLTTKEGISTFDPNDYTTKNYPVKNGQLYSDFTFKCGANTHQNLLLFGSKQGFVYFNPANVKPIDARSPLFVNEFRVFDRIVKHELTHGDTIVLQHNENFFSFEFSLLDFRMPQEVAYTFQLLNYDKLERTPAGQHNMVSYTDVPPGKYIFSLSASSADYIEPYTINILVIIKPAFYQTKLFRASVYFAILLVIAIIVLSFVRRQILRARLQKMELHLLRSQIDPHFIFNTLTSIQHSILTSSKEAAIETLSKFSRLMRMSLDYSRMEYIPLDKALSFYETFVAVHSLNLDEKIVFNVDIDSAINPEKIKISPMLLQPFIENAIVHGLTPKNRDMKIDLWIRLSDNLLHCTIRDNGVGRKKAEEVKQKKASGHKSVGIDITRKSILAQLKKGRFISDTFSIEDNFDEHGNAAGTTVYLKIPFRE